jgi:hypothetical protein
MLKESTKALTDLTNYIMHGTKPTEGVVTYATLIETWRNLLFNNEKKVLEKKLIFHQKLQSWKNIQSPQITEMYRKPSIHLGEPEMMTQMSSRLMIY